MRPLYLIALTLLFALVGLAVPLHEAAGQATPVGPPV